jgi:hypothetical protein
MQLKRWQSVLLNSPRYRPGPSELSEYAAHHLHGPDYGIHGVGETAWHELMKGTNGWHNTHDSFGNLEAFPPFGDWTSGVIYHGHEQTDGRTWNPADWIGWTYPGEIVNGMKNELVNFLAAQEVQGNPPHRVDTSWLNVAHVDEFISVQRMGGDNFVVILASPQMGIDILTGLAAHGFVFAHGQLWDPGEPPWTAEELLNHIPDPVGAPGFRIRDFNADVIQPQVNAARADMIAMGISDFVEVPAYFVSLVGGLPAASGPARLVLPDMVNMLNVNGTLIVPDPNPHPGIDWPGGGDDPFKEAFENAVGAGTEIRWIDCLEYHWGQGQVHCATNVRRTPREEIRQWWLVEP